jgi:hypothetical protein
MADAVAHFKTLSAETEIHKIPLIHFLSPVKAGHCKVYQFITAYFTDITWAYRSGY